MADIQISPANYGGARHPGWYYNLIAHPECELHIGPRGGRFVAHEVEGGERPAVRPRRRPLPWLRQLCAADGRWRHFTTTLRRLSEIFADTGTADRQGVA